jgi:hypothetical protein
MSSDSPTDRELLQQMLRRLERIEKHLGIAPWSSSIGEKHTDAHTSRVPSGPIETALPPGTLGPPRVSEPPPLIGPEPKPKPWPDTPGASSKPEE